MGYLGGKSKGAKHIVDFLNNPEFDGMTYIEPFVGYCNILRRVKNKSKYIASDNNPYLIHLLKHIQNSDEYFSISKDEYDRYRKTSFDELTGDDKIKACFGAFSYSYAGKMWGGYHEKSGKRNYAEEHKRYYKKLSQNEIFKNTVFSLQSYDTYNPKNCLIYCDPPYAQTTGYRGTGSWDVDTFWNIVRKWSKDNIVVVSEYNAPDDFECISYVQKKSTLNTDRTGGGKDCLFKLKKIFVI